MRSIELARELIEAILKPSSGKRPLVRIALQLEEALNLDFETPAPEELEVGKPQDDAATRYSLLEIE